jgi:hypothetical protein
MSPKEIPNVTVIHVKFDSLAGEDDQTVINEMLRIFRFSKKRPLPKSIKYDRCQVIRQQNLLTIKLSMGPTETARFCFAPANL